MRLRTTASLLLAGILPFAAGCRSSAPRAVPPPTGSIQGSITFSGLPPKPNTAPSKHAAGSLPCKLDPFFKRGQDRILPRTQPPVFLWISAGLQQHTFPAPRQQAILTQSRCRFQPQILGVLPNQPVDFANNDPFNVHFRVSPRIAGNPNLRLTLRPQKPGMVRSFPHPELMIPVTAPQRPSMRAWINVVPNPFFTLSGPRGRFTLSHLPPGTYSLSAISPGYPTQTQSLTVRANAVTPATFTFRYAAPPSQSSPRK